MDGHRMVVKRVPAGTDVLAVAEQMAALRDPPHVISAFRPYNFEKSGYRRDVVIYRPRHRCIRN